MAILERIIDKDLLSSFWGNASEKIDARIAAAKASLATTSTAGLVKPGSGLAVASDGTLSAKVDGSTIDFNSSGQLTALGGGEVTQKVVSLAANETLPLGNLTMQVLREGIYFVTVSQQQAYDALLVNAVFAVVSHLDEPGFYFQCADGNNATKWVVNSIEAPDLIRTQFSVPVFGGYVQRDAQSYNKSYSTCVASQTRLIVNCASSSRAAFYLYPLTVVRYH